MTSIDLSSNLEMTIVGGTLHGFHILWPWLLINTYNIYNNILIIIQMFWGKSKIPQYGNKYELLTTTCWVAQTCTSMNLNKVHTLTPWKVHTCSHRSADLLYNQYDYIIQRNYTQLWMGTNSLQRKSLHVS